MMVTQKNVREEVLSTMSLAEFAIEQGVKKNPDFLSVSKRIIMN
jgi:hypothetical protein